MVASISRHQLDGTTFIWLALGSIRSNNNNNNHNNMCSATHPATAAQVRRAAGSKDPNIFPKVLEERLDGLSKNEMKCMAAAAARARMNCTAHGSMEAMMFEECPTPYRHHGMQCHFHG